MDQETPKEAVCIISDAGMIGISLTCQDTKKLPAFSETFTSFLHEKKLVILTRGSLKIRHLGGNGHFEGISAGDPLSDTKIQITARPPNNSPP